MDLQDRQVLNLIQTAFPMDERPYLAIGKELGLGEDEVIERIRRLRQENVVRQISAIFDTRGSGTRPRSLRSATRRSCCTRARWPSTSTRA